MCLLCNHRSNHEYRGRENISIKGRGVRSGYLFGLRWALLFLLTSACQTPQDENSRESYNSLEVSYGGILATSEIHSKTPRLLSLELGGGFGVSAVALGDLDGPEGKSVTVVAVGAHRTSGKGSNEHIKGSVYLLWLLPDGSVLKSQRIDDESPALAPHLYESSLFGYAIEALGDLDGPGDYAQVLAVGAPYHRAKSEYPDYHERGGLFLLWIYPDGSVGKVVVIDRDSPNGPLLRDQVQFGNAVAFLGDLDGPGGADFALAVGAPSSGFPNPGDRFSEGEVHILFLHNDGSIMKSILFDREAQGFPRELALYDEFGYALANLGDLDGVKGPSATVLAVGAPSINEGNYDGLGGIYLLWLNPDGSLLRLSRIGRDTSQAPPIVSGRYFGIDIEALGDIDGAGGATQLIAVGQYEGIWLMSLAGDGSMLGYQKIDHSTPNGIPFDPDDINGYGGTIALIGDLDEDTESSLVIGVGDPTPAGHSGMEHPGGSFYLHYILFHDLP